MRVRNLLLTLALATAFVDPASAGPDQDNKTVVLDFYETAFVKHQPKQAADRYLAEGYIQHNPRVPNGRAAFSEFFTGHFARNPAATSTVKRVLADGDLVAVHSHSKLNPQDRGRAIIDLFRVRDGQIVEHWDVIQDVPETSANGNTMFD